MYNMQAISFAILLLHILSGFTALVSGGISSLTKKGGPAHRRSGKWYFWAMTGVFITATALGLLKSNAFLFMVGFFSYYLVCRGYRLLYLKKLGQGQKAAGLDWGISLTALAFGIGLLGWALQQQMAGSSFWPVPLVFGIISGGFALADLKLYTRGPAHKQHWLTGHIASMGGGYIATWTAFVVTNNHFLPPVVAWLLPSVVGTVLISTSIRRYTRPKRGVARPIGAV